MQAQLIDGKAIAEKQLLDLQQHVSELRTQGLPAPVLAVVLVGDDPASQLYVSRKKKSATMVGIENRDHHLPADTTQADLLALIQTLNQDDSVHGILVQLPLPAHLNAHMIIEHIDPRKDVDGFHPFNLGRLAARQPSLRPCTPYGVIKLLDAIDHPVKGSDAVIVGASNIVGRPMALELLLAGASVSVCHRFTHDLKRYVEQADLLIACAGKPALIPGEWVKPGATVIDVGINRLDNGDIVGDVAFAAACERAAWITPVPGGVGPMTVAMLMHNTVLAYQQARGLASR